MKDFKEVIVSTPKRNYHTDRHRNNNPLSQTFFAIMNSYSHQLFVSLLKQLMQIACNYAYVGDCKINMLVKSDY